MNRNDVGVEWAGSTTFRLFLKLPKNVYESVAVGLSGGLEEGSWRTISLQIRGGPQEIRTPDLYLTTASVDLAPTSAPAGDRAAGLQSFTPIWPRPAR